MSDKKELITMPVEATELGIGQLKKQVDKIQAVMRSIMKEGVHYGTVPGVKQKFLFKPGAEKLAMTFRLIPRYHIDKTLHEPINGASGHITYDITCDLIHQNSNAFVGQGVGSCSTLEKKYRYRNDDMPTGVEVPPAWWKERKSENLPKILKNSGVTPKTADYLHKHGLEIAVGKVDGKSQVVYRKKIENSDIADVYNTVIKMAKKRALVDAVITALSVGDMFTQDPDSVGSDIEETATEAEKEASKAKGSSAPAKRTTTRRRRSSSGK